MMITSEQRHWLANKLTDLANAAAAALIFGQFISSSFRQLPALFGFLFVVLVYIYSYFILKRIK
jgi:hypothetical protein